MGDGAAKNRAIDHGDLESVFAESDGGDKGVDAEAALKAKEKEGRPIAEATIISEDAAGSDVAAGVEGVQKDVDEQPEASEGEQAKVSQAAGSEESEKRSRFAGLTTLLAKRRLHVVGFLIGVVLAAAVTGSGRWFGEQGGAMQPPLMQVYLASIGGDTADVLFFDKFFVLMGDEDKPAYLLTSLTMTPSNSEVFKEAREKRTACRSVIYEVLKKAVESKDDKAMDQERMRQDIANALNAILVSGTVEKVAFVEFLVV
jgi:flagellar basal body-associated protein FliL